MNIGSEIKETRIGKYERPEEIPDPDPNVEIKKASENDFDYFKESKKYSSEDVRLLTTSDICAVAKKGDDVVCHVCVATKSFQPPGTDLAISLSKHEAYIYKGLVEKKHRNEGIFQSIHKRLYRVLDQNIQVIYNEVDSLNEPSLRAVKKGGFKKCGERYTISSGDSKYHIINGWNIYQDTLELSSPDLHIAKTENKKFRRIESELEPYVNRWAKEDSDIVLFGAGNHAKEILRRVKEKSVIKYAIDEDSTKHNTNVPGAEIPIHPIQKIAKYPPDAVVICSEAYQSEMVSRIQQHSTGAEIIVLYPQVSKIDKSGD
ncbi:hypothetical protein KY092_16320 [Natronomonas gomsonensis]|uniref:hypothetical protein n=1 Tax=Natronomonas gomsonensis TaxID=1046043 RepID=UPI00227CFEB5|nr:hypothetical protein [Natronomonas gomsonensis]MCY4732127.1 hypothetical protein [Natronomonas gomsonensis]